MRRWQHSLKYIHKYKILDVYPTNIKTWPERENAMDISYVMEKIYLAMLNSENELILDGRK